MKIQMTKPPLRGHIIGNTIFLQTADWRNVCQYDYIKFYANARSLIVMPEDGKIAIGNRFIYRQITSGDQLLIKESSTEKEISNRILALLHKCWVPIVENEILPPQDLCAFPIEVKCTLEIPCLEEHEKKDVSAKMGGDK